MSPWHVPRVLVTVDWPPILTVAENPPSGGSFGDVGCQVMEVLSHDMPYLFVPDASKVAQCSQQHTELWVSNQPWDTIVTVKLRFELGKVTLIQGSETISDLTYALDGGLHLTYRLVHTKERIASLVAALPVMV